MGLLSRPSKNKTSCFFRCSCYELFPYSLTLKHYNQSATVYKLVIVDAEFYIP